MPFVYRARPRAYIGLRLMALDANIDTLERIHSAIEGEIARGERALERARKSGNPDMYDSIVDDECDQVEELLGIAFVAAQPFINRTRTHFCWINKACEEDFGRKLGFFAAGNKPADILKRGDLVAGKAVSLVEAIYAVGNFWKHADQWPVCEQKKGKHLVQVWDGPRMTGQQKPTYDMVTALGLTPRSSGNLRHASKAIGVKKYSNLAPMRKALKEWADDLRSFASTELETLIAGLSPRKGRQLG